MSESIRANVPVSRSPLNSLLKFTFDYVATVILLVITIPLFVVIYHLIRRDGGPAIFRQSRVGAGGQPFCCLKFRTMVTDADEVLEQLLSTNQAAAQEWAESQKLRDDPRITPIGRILRKMSLDEIPQLINVLRGEMSLVGPRPIVEKEVQRYGQRIRYYIEARPGITGLWQVSGRCETTYEERIMFDVDYVREWSLRKDFAILMRTIVVVIRGRGAL